MALHVIIADDEAASRGRLRDFLAPEPDILVVAECGDGNSALEAIRRLDPDLVFLDVQLPELNGIEVIRSLPPQDLPVLIFVTAHHSYAIDAFAFSAADYLLKPFDYPRFKKALQLGRDRVRQRTRKTGPADEALADGFESGHLAVRSSGKITLVPISRIEWIQGAGNYAELRLGRQSYLVRRTLTSLQRRLPAHFFRISKSQIVNTRLIRELKPKSHGDCIVTLQDGTALTVTRHKRSELKRRLQF